MFDKKYLDPLSIERGAIEINCALYHFNKFVRKDIKKIKDLKNSGYPEYAKMMRLQYLKSIKDHFKYYNDCIRNAHYYLGVSNKTEVNKLIFKYKYCSEIPTVNELIQLIEK